MSAEWPIEPGEPWAVRDPLREAEESRRRAEATAAIERGIAERFARLHATTAALSAAVTPGDVAAVIAARAVALPGAVASAVGLLSDRAQQLRIATVRGRGDAAATRPAPVAVTADVPLAAAVRERRARFVDAGAPDGAAAIASVAAACGVPPAGVRAGAALPLTSGELILGAVAIAFGARRTFDEEERAFLEAFAHQCGQALDRARLYEAERAARLEAQRAEEAARRAVELQERLVGVVGHDLRTPLAAIRMATSLLLRRGGLSDEQSRTLARLGASAGRMTGIIRDLLDFTRIRKDGTIPVELKVMDLADVARRAAAELHAIHPDREIALDVPEVAVCVGDPERLAQVISNLLGNAIQHSPHGTPVRVRIEVSAQGPALAVHNDGPPIPPALLPHIFEPFRQGVATPGASGSVGLGLFIVRELVRAHGGAVEVASDAPRGTTFTVRLPRLGAAHPDAPVPTGPAAPER